MRLETKAETEVTKDLATQTRMLRTISLRNRKIKWFIKHQCENEYRKVGQTGTKRMENPRGQKCPKNPTR